MADHDLNRGDKNRKNARVALSLAGVVVGMIAFSFASVPLYRLFCQVTGFGGTTQVAETAPQEVGERVISVRFNADVNDKLPWRFSPLQREVEVQVGENRLVFYQAQNVSERPVTGTATFNVTPLKAGPYFSKIACFCFTEQRLESGQQIDMPVSFFVDPAIMDDPDMDDVKTITLSYTFFRDLDDMDDPAEEEQQTTQNLLGNGSLSATGIN